MATNTLTGRDNLLGAAQLTHNDDMISVANVLDESNPFVQDAPLQEAISIESHVIARTTALPTASLVKVGNGWDSSIGTYQQAREAMAMIKARYQCPKDVMRLQPKPAAYRAQRERDAVEGMAQGFANTLIGSSTKAAPESFDGLLYRYNTLSTSRTSYVVSNGGSDTGTLTSIWFVQWSPSRVYLIYPRGSTNIGITKEDKGEQFVDGDNSKKLWAYVTEFAWDVGLAVEDTRSVKRLCNIDTTLTDTYTVDEDKIIQILNNFRGNDQVYMYCNETVFTQLDILAKDKTNVRYEPGEPFGRKGNVMTFRGVPVKVCDAIGDTESTVS